uniref:Uncharacterized protein n=1 Tax=Glossina palpalis gambiensis TaxID=67801 RepID=A0A1B0C0G2_9MUSC
MKAGFDFDMISLIKHHLTVMWSLLIFSVVMLMHNTFIAPLPLLKPSSSYASAAALEIISTRPTTLFITSSLSASTTPSTISLTKFFINANLSKYLQQLNHHQYQQQQYPAEYFSPSNNLFGKASFTSRHW